MLLLPDNLKTIRQVWHVNQDEMATLLNIKKGQYVAYETGRNEPNLNIMFKLEDLTGLSSRQLCSITLAKTDVTLPNPKKKGCMDAKNASLAPHGTALVDILNKLDLLLDKLEKE